MTAERKAKRTGPERMMYQNGFIDGEEAGAAKMRRNVLRVLRALRDRWIVNGWTYDASCLDEPIAVVAALGKPKAKQRGRR